MIDYYINLQQGKSKDEALLKAKKDSINKNKGQAASPFYWASIISIGDMSKF